LIHIRLIDYNGTKIHTSRQDYFDDVVRLAKMAEQVNL